MLLPRRNILRRPAAMPLSSHFSHLTQSKAAWRHKSTRNDTPGKFASETVDLHMVHTYTHTREDQCEWHRVTRMTGPDCAVMRNLISTHTHTHQVSLIPSWEDQCEWHRMTSMTGPDYAVMCNLINAHTHTSRLIRGFRNKYH